MNRLVTMARFNETEPEEPRTVAHCGQCGEPLHRGQEVIYDSRHGEYYCDTDCFREFIKANIIDEVYEYVDILQEIRDIYHAWL